MSPFAKIWWVAIQAVLTRWTSRGDRFGRIGLYGLIVFGAAECIGALGEPITYAIFSADRFDPFLAVIQAGMIALPAVMAILGARALPRRGLADASRTRGV